jgi:hypothetical protein
MNSTVSCTKRTETSWFNVWFAEPINRSFSWWTFVDTMTSLSSTNKGNFLNEWENMKCSKKKLQLDSHCDWFFIYLAGCQQYLMLVSLRLIQWEWFATRTNLSIYGRPTSPKNPIQLRNFQVQHPVFTLRFVLKNRVNTFKVTENWRLVVMFSVFKLVLKIAEKDYLLCHVCLFACSNLALTWRNFMKIDVSEFLQILSRKLKFH